MPLTNYVTLQQIHFSSPNAFIYIWPKITKTRLAVGQTKCGTHSTPQTPNWVGLRRSGVKKGGRDGGKGRGEMGLVGKKRQEKGMRREESGDCHGASVNLTYTPTSHAPLTSPLRPCLLLSVCILPYKFPVLSLR